MDTDLKAGEIAPYSGVLVPRARYNWLVRCEGYVVERGVLP